MTKVKLTIEMEMHEEDFESLLNHTAVETYRAVSEITKGNIVLGKIEEE